jgi:hypothetical protein
MGFFSPDPPKQPAIPPRPDQSQISPVSPDAAPWYQADQIAKGLMEAPAEALRRRQQAGGNPVPSPPPGEYRPS